jgi:DNA-binding NarL/FixJ family response regulator
LFRECLSSALEAVDQIETTFMDEPNIETVISQEQDGHNVLLLDASLPEMKAFRFVQNLRTNDLGLRTILLISTSAPDLIECCLQAGADGCVLEEDTLDDLRRGIESVLAGQSYCSPRLAERLFTFKRSNVQKPHLSMSAREVKLTRRELEILRLIAERNLSNKQIARELRLSIYTVKNHMHSVIEKLSVEDRQTAVRHAALHGLLRDPVV